MDDLLISNPKKLLDCAAEFGTPLYVYDGNKIVSQYKRLKDAFSGLKFRVHYACKANTNLNILRLLKNAGCELDTVSIQEIRLGLHAGFQPENIMYTPNSVNIEEIKVAVEIGVNINIDSLSILEQFGNVYGNKVPVCIRINPHVVAGGHSKIQTGHIDSKFGISYQQMRLLNRIIDQYHIDVQGVHMHNGSDIKEIDTFMEAVDVLLKVASEFKDLKYIDFGGGIKVPYKEGDVETNVEELGTKMTKKFKAFCKEYGRELELWCEPGKFLVSESGYLLTRVNIVKHTVSTVFAGVDSGLNHLIRPMMYNAYHRIVNISNPKGLPRVYSVVGNICETDTFGSDRKISEIREGDILAILNAGAYGFSMSSNYNSRFRPAEVLLMDGSAKLIRKREEMEDLLRNQVEI